MSDQRVFANIIVLRAEGATPKVPAKFEAWMPASSVIELAQKMKLGVPENALARDVSLWKVKDDWKTRQIALDDLNEAANEMPLTQTLETTLPNNILGRDVRVSAELKDQLHLVVVYNPKPPQTIDLDVD